MKGVLNDVLCIWNHRISFISRSLSHAAATSGSTVLMCSDAHFIVLICRLSWSIHTYCSRPTKFVEGFSFRLYGIMNDEIPSPPEVLPLFLCGSLTEEYYVLRHWIAISKWEIYTTLCPIFTRTFYRCSIVSQHGLIFEWTILVHVFFRIPFCLRRKKLLV